MMSCVPAIPTIMKVPLLDTPMLMISAGAACNQNHSSGTVYDVFKKFLHERQTSCTLSSFAKCPSIPLRTSISTHMGVNQRSKQVTQVQQQRLQSPMVTLTWHACKYKVHKLHQRFVLVKLSSFQRKSSVAKTPS